ncbi:hypothetical protein QSV34_11140 [Porticoccus sp. W117]|uniref:hypothetical protein n=1 Tax=Porticoccus sp. W117 TaxID=3054777 RepID=UPI0025923FAB|nr:hypothetical protein [Porticoccus sp. W117]MDM3871906.1 hypothetical protein [Porticoccus sp. W117]
MSETPYTPPESELIGENTAQLEKDFQKSKKDLKHDIFALVFCSAIAVMSWLVFRPFEIAVLVIFISVICYGVMSLFSLPFKFFKVNKFKRLLCEK